MQKETIKSLIEKAFEVSETISEFKKFVLDIIDSADSRIITINIGTLQKNYGVNETKAEAANAIEKLTEMIDNFSKGGNEDEK